MKQLKTGILLFAVVFAVLMVIPAVSAAITEERIQNGGFDSSLSPWFQSGSDSGGSAHHVVYWIASGGNPGGYAQLYVDGGGGSGWANIELDQTVDLTDVNTITFSCRLDEYESASMSDGNSSVSSSFGLPLIVEIDSTTIDTFYLDLNVPWQNRFITVPESKRGPNKIIKFYTSTSSGKMHKIGIDTVSALATISPPAVYSVSPGSALNTSPVSVSITGSGFRTGDTVTLYHSGQSNMTATGVTVVSPSQITCTFDITNKPAGVRDVVVTDTYGQTGSLTNGFNVTAPPPVIVKTKIGVVRNNNTWLLDASGNGAWGAGDLTYTFGTAGDKYVTGDWNNDGKTEIGVVRDNNTWLLDASGNGAWGAGDLTYTFGTAGDKYVTGDWNNDGKTEIGVVRDNDTWLLDASGNGAWGAGDLTYTFGTAGDKYVTGDWNSDGKTEIGVYRNGTTWLLDSSGNGSWGAGDTTYTFGKAGDIPVTGIW